MKRIASYEDAAEYLKNLPRFSPLKIKSGEEAYNLLAIKELLDLAGHPEASLPIVHVTGTNGKGSVIAYMEQILLQSGIRAGTFTSPYLEEYTECMTFCGQEIPRSDFAAILRELAGYMDVMEGRGHQMPSEFELLTAIAFIWLAGRKCELLLLEVGMGGARDATNVIPPPLLSVFTPISLDHTQVLGETVREIAVEKSGIIKKGTVVVSAPQIEEAMAVLKSKAEEVGAELFTAGSRLPETIPFYPDAPYQEGNAALALASIDQLERKGFVINRQVIGDALRLVRRPGRFEIVQTSPDIIIDGSHNPEGIRTLAEALQKRYQGRRIILIIGMLADKNRTEMLKRLIPLSSEIHTITPDNIRALCAAELKEEILRLSGHPMTVISHDTLEGMKESVLKACESGDVICATGSLYTTAALRNLFKNRS
jgi:dihydrofolate synthase/folylpolyglutamate synthase